MTQSLDPFITAEDVVGYLGRGGTADAGILMAVDAACDICRTVAEQTFNEVVGGTVTRDGTGTDTIILPELPVSAAGTVAVNGGTITDYALNGNGVLLRGTAGSGPRPVWPQGRQNVVVTYDHGYPDADLPRDVRMVAVAIASRLVLQGPALQEAVGDVSVRYAVANTDLTAGEQAILRKYRQSA